MKVNRAAVKEIKSTLLNNVFSYSSEYLVIWQYFKNSMVPYSKRPRCTKIMQKIIHDPIDEIVSAFGELVVTDMKMLTRHKIKVIRSAILPGMISGGIIKLTCKTVIIFYTESYEKRITWGFFMTIKWEKANINFSGHYLIFLQH